MSFELVVLLTVVVVVVVVLCILFALNSGIWRFDLVLSLPLQAKVDGGCFHPSLSVSRISQKVMHGSGQNLVERLGV